MLKMELNVIQEGVSAKLKVVTLEEYVLFIDWTITNGLELRKMIVDDEDVLQADPSGGCGGSGEEAEKIQTHYEDLHGMLMNLSPDYQDSFSSLLSSKLSALAKAQQM